MLDVLYNQVMILATISNNLKNELRSGSNATHATCAWLILSFLANESSLLVLSGLWIRMLSYWELYYADLNKSHRLSDFFCVLVSSAPAFSKIQIYFLIKINLKKFRHFLNACPIVVCFITLWKFVLDLKSCPTLWQHPKEFPLKWNLSQSTQQFHGFDRKNIFENLFCFVLFFCHG